MTVPHHIHAFAARCAVVAVVASVALGTGFPVSVSFGSAPVNTVDPEQVAGDVGDVVLIDLDGDQITSGSASTSYFVRLPEGAACPGDSANDQWRVNTFLIPSALDPLDVLFGSSGPEPPWTSGLYPLYDIRTNLPIVFTMLRKNATAGSPGLIESVPETSFAVVAENQFPGGDYRLGIACTYFAQTTQYWDIELQMSAAPNVTWVASTDQKTNDRKPESTSESWALVLGAVVIAGLGIVWWARRRTASAATTTSPTKQLHVGTTITKESS